jgi:hypothetical protein
MTNLGVFLFWLGGAEGASIYLYKYYGGKGVRIAMAACMFAWIGFLVAISMTEAWLKFRAKLLTRHAGLDVGRLLFSALNSLEAAMCATILSLLFAFEPLEERIWALPIVLSLILLLQVLYLTPRLALRAYHTQCEDLAKLRHASRAEESAYKEYRAIITLLPKPPLFLHHLYVILEMVKILLLFRGAETMLTT